MEQLPNDLTLQIAGGAFPLSTDSMVLSRFVRLPKTARVLDLGSGCGTLGLLLCASDTGCRVTGIELEPAAHDAAVENILRNSLGARMTSICADLREFSSLLCPGNMDVVVSNPPYFPGGPEALRNPNARRENQCTLKDLFAAAAWALKYGGDFFLVHRPERLAELIACASRSGMEAKRLCVVRHRPGSAPAMILLSFRKGGKPGLVWEEETLYHADGSPTSYYKSVYHL